MKRSAKKRLEFVSFEFLRIACDLHCSHVKFVSFGRKIRIEEEVECVAFILKLYQN